MESIAIVNVLLIGIICLYSYFSFSNSAFVEKNIFDPQRILVNKEYYRLVSSAFIHTDLIHLLFNCFSLYSFGRFIELVFGIHYFLIIFFSSVLGGSLLSLYLHRNHSYRALGASGGVCGIIFASIFLIPDGSIQFLLIPIPIPAWTYAIFFLFASIYGIKSGRGNIGHDAHLGGAIIGLLVTTILQPNIIAKSLPLYFLVLIISILFFYYLYITKGLNVPFSLNPVSDMKKFITDKKDSVQQVNKEKQEEMVDTILEKISKEGLEKLTPKEKKILNQASEQKRKQNKPK